jgi:hypothetical protein
MTKEDFSFPDCQVSNLYRIIIQKDAEQCQQFLYDDV